MAIAGIPITATDMGTTSVRNPTMTTGISINGGVTTINAIIATQIIVAVITKAASGSAFKTYTV
jgi:hypothetical protein